MDWEGCLRRRKAAGGAGCLQRAGSLAGPKLLEALGAEVFTINVTPDGSFRDRQNHWRRTW